jgi:hypothetical protein
VCKILSDALWSTETIIEKHNPIRAYTHHQVAPPAGSQDWIDQGPLRGVAPKKAAAPSADLYLAPAEVAKASSAARPESLGPLRPPSKSPPPAPRKKKRSPPAKRRRSPSEKSSGSEGRLIPAPRLHPSAKHRQKALSSKRAASPGDPLLVLNARSRRANLLRLGGVLQRAPPTLRAALAGAPPALAVRGTVPAQLKGRDLPPLRSRLDPFRLRRLRLAKAVWR